jgi:hypothetical protein
MEPGLKRTLIARFAAGLGCLSGFLGFLSAITGDPLGLTPHGWGIGGMLLLLLAIFILVDGVVSFERVARKSAKRRMEAAAPSILPASLPSFGATPSVPSKPNLNACE